MKIKQEKYLKFKSTIISLFLFYFWAITFFFENSSVNSLMFTIPSLLFTLFFTGLFVFEGNKKRVEGTGYLIFFLFGSLLTCVVNNEIQNFITTLIFTMPILLINQKSIRLNLKFVNFLFVLTIIFGILSYHLGPNIYGYLPGHSFLKGQTPWWRVSLFPYSTPSINAFFFLFTYIYNLEKKKKIFKIIRIISIYFIFLSGSRTVVLSFLFIILYRFLSNKVYVRQILPYLTVIVPLFIMFSSYIFILSNNEFILEFILRGRQIEDQDSIVRLQLFENLLTLFFQNPFFGLGSYNLYDYFPNTPSFSESKWLSLLSTQGIFTFFLLIFFLSKYKKNVNKNSKIAYGVLTIIPAMFFYGSFYVPYNIIFFFNIFLFNHDEEK